MTTTDVIHTHRSHVFGIAYRMLGTAADAEDALQETFLRWHKVVSAGTIIESDRAWLTTTVTRICLDELRSARAKRESYVGPWLPEPLIADSVPDVAEAAVMSDSLSTAFLMVLERLSPRERAVFLLHDVFAYDFATIAGIVGESEAYCRQIAKRARAHVAEERPRYPTPPAKQRELLDHFVAAYTEGNVSEFAELLAEDVTIWADSGGQVQALPRPISGRDRVSRFLLGISSKFPPDYRNEATTINGQPGVKVVSGDHLIGVVSLDIHDGLVHGIYIVVNPDKLPPSA